MQKKKGFFLYHLSLLLIILLIYIYVKRFFVILLIINILIKIGGWYFPQPPAVGSMFILINGNSLQVVQHQYLLNIVAKPRE